MHRYHLDVRYALMSDASQEHEIKTLFGRKVAIDASMSIYQFLIAVRSKDGEVLTNEAGETTRQARAERVYYFLRVAAHPGTVISWGSSIVQYEWWKTGSSLLMYLMASLRSSSREW